MPFEALECFTVSLMSAAAVSYAAELATPSTLATLQGMYGGLHYGVGKCVLHILIICYCSLAKGVLLECLELSFAVRVIP